jgi:hypothetical protein
MLYKTFPYMNKISAVLIIILVFLFKPAHSQLLQGDWRDHLSYRQCYSIADAGDWVFCGAKSGLISYNEETNTLRKHSKVTGLSDVLVSAIGYSSESNLLVVGYANGNIDLLREGDSPTNLSDIKRKILAADKKIYDIFIYGQSAYLSCGFGIVVLNLEQKEIKETYILGENGTYIKVNDLTILDNKIYAATEMGIVAADINSGNLLDYKNWYRINILPQHLGEFKQIEDHQEKLFAVYNEDASGYDRIITFDESNYQEWNGVYDTVVNGIHSSNGYFSISCPARGIIYTSNYQLLMTTVSYGNSEIYVKTMDEIFVAATYSGFTLWNSNQEVKYLPISGPNTSLASKVCAFSDQVWVTTGGPSAPYIGGEAYSYLEGKWTSYLSNDFPTTDPIGNTYKVAIDPRDPSHVFVTSYTYGLIEFRNGEIYKVYEEDYEDLFDDFRPYVGLRISGLDFDNFGNLWMVMDLVSKPLFKIDTEGNWSRPNIPSNTMLSQERTLYSDLLVTKDGHIWILGLSLGIVVLRDDGTDHFEAKSFNIKNQSGNQLTSGFCLEEDNEGNIWVGTNNGPIVYYSPWNIFYLNDVSGYQIPIPRNDGTNLIDYLLFNDAIPEIETDGGDRKWFATENSGVFLVSADANETLLNFKNDNSPLLSNNVTGIGINQKNGEVFFATALGLVSYGGTATKGASDYSDVYVYPNPVNPDYEGNITVKGLVENSIVKITDVSGNLVWETKSLGGQAIWDGHNFDGDKVATGVYLIMLATEDGSKSHITKVLFMH